MRKNLGSAVPAALDFGHCPLVFVGSRLVGGGAEVIPAVLGADPAGDDGGLAQGDIALFIPDDLLDRKSTRLNSSHA